jgi:carboxyl-terminal processing protease
MQWLQLRALAAVAALALAFGAGVYSGVSNYRLQAAVYPSAVPADIDLASFWKAWHALEDDYVPTSASTTLPTDEERVWGAIQGLVESYNDPYTVFLPPQEAEEFAEEISGAFEGVGMEVGVRDGVLVVVAPLKNTPAEQAGIRSGDRILAIDGMPAERMPVDEAVSLIRGERGSVVDILVAREGAAEPIEIPITRNVIELPTINYFERPDGVYVIELYNFSGISVQRFREALREFVRSGKEDLILDLRGNPGGYLEASVEMASYFLPAGATVVVEDFSGKRENILHRSRGYNVFAGRPLSMVVLVNGGSASASEILAGALGEHGVATLAGSQTFGKGSVQQLIEIGGGAELKLTVARWLTPQGVSISDGGLTPDLVVERTPEDIQNDRDPQLERAVEYLLGTR